MEHWELIPLFFSIAFLYSIAGFGGGSSYLAVMALWSIEYKMLRTTALLCNIVVVAGNAWIFRKKGFLDLKRSWPLVATSVPMAFVGGLIPLNQRFFFILLGAALIVAGLLMLFQKKPTETLTNPANSTTASQFGWGAGIGFLSGMVGIGGGIFLSPILHLRQWANPKAIAATSSFFILVNSLGGLGGQLLQPGLHLNWNLVIPLVGSVFLGGQLGSRLTVQKFPHDTVRLLTAFLILFVAVRLLIKHLY